MYWVKSSMTAAAVCTLAALAGCSGQTNNPLVRAQPSILANLPYQPFMPQPDGQSDLQSATPTADSPPAGSDGAQSATSGNAAEFQPGAADHPASVASLGATSETSSPTDNGAPANAVASGFPAHIGGTHPAATGAAAPPAIPDIQPVTTGTYTFTLPHNVSSFKKFGDLLFTGRQMA